MSLSKLLQAMADAPEPSNAERYEAAMVRVRVIHRMQAAAASPEFVRAVMLANIDAREVYMGDAADVLQTVETLIAGLSQECDDEIRETAPPAEGVKE